MPHFVAMTMLLRIPGDDHEERVRKRFRRGRRINVGVIEKEVACVEGGLDGSRSDAEIGRVVSGTRQAPAAVAESADREFGATEADCLH